MSKSVRVSPSSITLKGYSLNSNPISEEILKLSPIKILESLKGSSIYWFHIDETRLKLLKLKNEINLISGLEKTLMELIDSQIKDCNTIIAALTSERVGDVSVNAKNQFPEYSDHFSKDATQHYIYAIRYLEPLSSHEIITDMIEKIKSKVALI